MSRYTADSRDRVREAVDMVALVGARVELERRGQDSYFGCCPFHDERTPSFHVRPDEKHYHCFGCSESGDPFDFVMQTEGLDFKGALEHLAERFGVSLQTEDEDPEAARRRQRRERLYSLMNRAATYYARYLWQSRDAAAAREYLLGRGFSEKILREFRVGFAPQAWDRLRSISRAADYDDQELLAAGLISRSKRNPQRLFDFFRGQVMFPIADARGRVRGFGARRLEGEGPKYVNTPEGELYRKREVLYGIDHARAHAARAGRIILVEGYTDVLALHQAGIRNAVGIMGTALTREQVAELARIAGVLELCLDSDSAGRQAAMKAAGVAGGANLELRVVALPPGTDPGELIASEGADALRERVSASVPFVVFEVERALQGAPVRTAEEKDRVISSLGPVFAELPQSVLRDELLQRVAGQLELAAPRLVTLLEAASDSSVRAAAATGSGAAGTTSRQPRQERPSDRESDRQVRHPELSAPRNERAFLAMCLAAPAAGEAALQRIDPDELLTSAVMRRAALHLRGRTHAPLAELPPDDDELARTVADLVARAGRGRQITADQLEHSRLLLELARLDRAIVRARTEHRPGIRELAQNRQQVREAIGSVASRIERPG